MRDAWSGLGWQEMERRCRGMLSFALKDPQCHTTALEDPLPPLSPLSHSYSFVFWFGLHLDDPFARLWRSEHERTSSTPYQGAG